VHSLAGHQAAVKALAWCPFQSNLLATGGGTADRTIRFWNTCTGAQLNSIDTGSQVRSDAVLQIADGRGVLQTESQCRTDRVPWRHPPPDMYAFRYVCSGHAQLLHQTLACLSSRARQANTIASAHTRLFCSALAHSAIPAPIFRPVNEPVSSLRSQVCALQWSRHEKEILSSHGFSQNQLCLWKYPSMAKIAEFSVRAPACRHTRRSCTAWHALNFHAAPALLQQDVACTRTQHL